MDFYDEDELVSEVKKQIEDNQRYAVEKQRNNRRKLEEIISDITKSVIIRIYGKLIIDLFHRVLHKARNILL